MGRPAQRLARPWRYRPTSWWNSAVPIGRAKDLVPDQLAIERVGIEQGLVVEDDVVDPDHVVLTEREIIQVGTALMQRKIERVVRVVIEVGAGRDDPVDEAGLDQGDQAAHPQTGGSQCARERQADGAVRARGALR